MFSVEVTLYVQAFSDQNPIFAPPWTPARPQLEVTVKEEQDSGTTVFSVTAKDPVTGMSCVSFSIVVCHSFRSIVIACDMSYFQNN